MSDSIILEVQNITHNFGKFRALSDVSLKIPTDAFVLLLDLTAPARLHFTTLFPGAIVRVSEKFSLKVGMSADCRHIDVWRWECFVLFKLPMSFPH